jgi:hypothetical protein
MKIAKLVFFKLVQMLFKLGMATNLKIGPELQRNYDENLRASNQ